MFGKRSATPETIAIPVASAGEGPLAVVLRAALAILVLGTGALAGALALAQDDVTVPNEFLETWRRTQGDRLVFCVGVGTETAEFDQAIGNALAESLLLEPSFIESAGGFGIDGAGFTDSLLVSLTNDCDVALGMGLVNSGYPDWLTVTRPYIALPYVIATMDPSFKNLLDVPRDQTIGTQIVSAGESRLIAYLGQLPQPMRWRRLPYGDDQLMLERLRDGSLAAIVIYEPTLMKLTGGDPGAWGIHLLPPEPLRDMEVLVGGVLLSRNVFLRNQLDTAIATLAADGTIARLMADHGLAGIPGGG